MKLEELKDYAKYIFRIHPDDEVSLQDILNTRAQYSDAATMYAIGLVANRMAQYIDELEKPSKSQDSEG